MSSWGPRASRSTVVLCGCEVVKKYGRRAAGEGYRHPQVAAVAIILLERLSKYSTFHVSSPSVVAFSEAPSTRPMAAHESIHHAEAVWGDRHTFTWTSSSHDSLCCINGHFVYPHLKITADLAVMTALCIFYWGFCRTSITLARFSRAAPRPAKEDLFGSELLHRHP